MRNTVLLKGLLVTMVTFFSTAHAQYAFVGNSGFDNTHFRNIFPQFKWSINPISPKPWYEGENVCVAENAVPRTGPDPFEGMDGNSRDTSTSCKGDTYKYVCVIKTRDNGVTKQTVKTYECCPGFVRGGVGCPGCIEG